LRDASDAILARGGARPKVFLANLGTPTDFTARATFARNFFAAGGIEAVDNDGFTTREEMIEAFKGAGANLACLCSSDVAYAREGIAAVQALRLAGASVWVAGRPATLESELSLAGVSGFIFAGCDVLAALRTAYSLLA